MLLQAKIIVRKIKGEKIDKEILKKRQKEAQIVNMECTTIEEAEEAVARAKEE